MKRKCLFLPVFIYVIFHCFTLWSSYTILDQMPDFVREDIEVCDVNNEQDCLFIMDRNLWALTTWAYWYFYQWWNNFWFDYSNWFGLGQINTHTQNKIEWHDEYNNSNFYWTSFIRLLETPPYDYWSDNQVHNWLRGWENDSQENDWWLTSKNYTDRQWPCPEWYHVPSAWERWNLIEYRKNNYTTWVELTNNDESLYVMADEELNEKFINNLLLPFWSRIYWEWWRDFYAGQQGAYWSSTPGQVRSRFLRISKWRISVGGNSNNDNYWDGTRTSAFMVRCFKNTYLLNFETNWWSDIKKQTIIENETWIKPDDPERSWSVFISWYQSWNDMELAFSDSIIWVLILNSFSINSATCCVHIPNSSISLDPQCSHLLGKLYWVLHMWHSQIFWSFILW